MQLQFLSESLLINYKDGNGKHPAKLVRRKCSTLLKKKKFKVYLHKQKSQKSAAGEFFKFPWCPEEYCPQLNAVVTVYLLNVDGFNVLYGNTVTQFCCFPTSKHYMCVIKS